MAKVPSGIRAMQDSNMQIDKARNTIHRKHTISKPEEVYAIEEALKPQISSQKNQACIIQKIKHIVEHMWRSKKK